MMVFGRVHDRTMADDYYRAMAVIEEQLECTLEQAVESFPESGRGWDALLALVDPLEVDDGQREIVGEIRRGLLALVT